MTWMVLRQTKGVWTSFLTWTLHLHVPVRVEPQEGQENQSLETPPLFHRMALPISRQIDSHPDINARMTTFTNGKQP